MKNIIKAAKLDFAIMKGHILPLCFGIVLPLLFVIEGSAFIVCIGLAMGITAMGLHYTFTIAEKKDMSRMFGIIPITKRDLVLGKYLYVLIIGLLVVAVSIITQSIALNFVGTALNTQEVLVAAFAGIAIYSIFVSVQLPGFYKFGGINGKVFAILPFATVVIVNGIIKRSGFDFDGILQLLTANQLLTVFITTIVIVLLLAVSIAISIRILKRKEL
jgi:hypothetical protein